MCTLGVDLSKIVDITIINQLEMAILAILVSEQIVGSTI